MDRSKAMERRKLTESDRMGGGTRIQSQSCQAPSGCEPIGKDLRTEANFQPGTQGPKPAETEDNKNLKPTGMSGSKKLFVSEKASFRSRR